MLFIFVNPCPFPTPIHNTYQAKGPGWGVYGVGSLCLFFLYTKCKNTACGKYQEAYFSCILVITHWLHMLSIHRISQCPGIMKKKISSLINKKIQIHSLFPPAQQNGNINFEFLKILNYQKNKGIKFHSFFVVVFYHVWNPAMWKTWNQKHCFANAF